MGKVCYMLYTRRKNKKPKPNWGRILLTLLAVVVVGLSVYFLSAGLSRQSVGQNGSDQQQSESPAVESPSAETSPSLEPSAQPTPQSESPAPEQATPEVQLTGQRRMTLGAVGDIASGEFLLKAASTSDGYDYSEMFARMAPYLQMQDYTLANLECVLAEEGEYSESVAPVQLADALKAVGFDVLGLANEHSLDLGVEGAMATANLVEDAGLQSAGAYASGADYLQPLILEGQDLRVAVLNYTASTLQTPDGAKDVVKYLDETTLENDMNAVRAQEEAVDFVVAMVHWGQEDAQEVTDEQKQWAKKLADAGVDVILGSHPHYLQPLEEIEASDGSKTLVAYSLGNFLSVQRTQGRDMGAILTFTLVKDYDAGTCYYENVSYQPSWVLRYSIEGKYHFEIMPVNEFEDKGYQNMGTEARERIRQVAEEVRQALGESVGKLDETILEVAE